MRTTANGRAGDSRASGQRRLRRFYLQIGPETVEVLVEREGLYFRHPDSPAAEGLLRWDEAIALALLPQEGRRHHSRPAA